MRKKLFAICFLVLMALPVFAFSVAAAFETYESVEGYPYDDYNNYNYFVGNNGWPSMTEDGNNRILTFNITVRSKKSVILSTDEYILTLKNLPPQEPVTIHEKMSAGERLESASYSVSASLPYIYQSGDWNEYSKRTIEGRSNMEGYTIKEGTFMGKKALVETQEEINSDFNRYRTRQISGSYFVYFDDIIIPNGIIVLRIDWNAWSFGYIGYSIPEYKDAAEALVSANYVIVKSDVQKLLDQYSAITFETQKVALMRKHDDKKIIAITTQETNTNASDAGGVAAVAVLSTIIVAAAVSVGGAGSDGGSEKSGDKEKAEKSSYKMVLYKEFGDKIRYNGETVFVYVKMIEVRPDGAELERLDLTQRIEIFSSNNFLQVSPAAIAGEYMGSSVSAVSSQETGMPQEGVISFRFNGEGGVFQNNVKFKMIGKCYIGLQGQNLYVLATSSSSFNMIYNLVDFEQPPQVEVKAWQTDIPFDLKIGTDKDEQTVIIATDNQKKVPFDKFFNSFSCEITAKNEKESTRTVFSVVMCYEGVLPDFLGKPKEIKGYKDEKGDMTKTLVSFSQALWNDTKKTLDLSKPENLQIECTDKNGVFTVIGLNYEPNPDYASIKDKAYYDFATNISLPAQSPIKGSMLISNTVGEKSFENKTEINLIPDLIEYSKNRETEYQNCLKIIETYLPTSFRERKLAELKKDYPMMGTEDIKLFRHNCWGIAQRLIMQEKESYLIESYWYDEAIATAELLVYIGDIAFDVALAPFGGPIAGFLAAQVKNSVIDMITLYVEKPSIGFNEMWEFIQNRFIQMAGQADGAFEMPKADQPKKLVAWLACFTLYRVCYHWWFTKDEDNNPIGVAQSIKNGLLDFAGKGAATILSNFAGDIAKKKGWDKYSIADADQAYVNEKMQKGMKTALDAGDKIASKLDDAVGSAVMTLLEFIEKIKNGSSAF